MLPEELRDAVEDKVADLLIAEMGRAEAPEPEALAHATLRRHFWRVLGLPEGKFGTMLGDLLAREDD